MNGGCDECGGCEECGGACGGSCDCPVCSRQRKRSRKYTKSNKDLIMHIKRVAMRMGIPYDAVLVQYVLSNL